MNYLWTKIRNIINIAEDYNLSIYGPYSIVTKLVK